MFPVSFPIVRQSKLGLGQFIIEVSRSHTVRHTLARARARGRTPLIELSARRTDLYLTTHNKHKRQTSMPPVGFKHAIPSTRDLQTYAFDRTTTEIGFSRNITPN